MKSSVPEIRISAFNEAPINPDGAYVLYWMTAFRRASWNYALDRAVDWAVELGKPLLVFEALRCDYPWASDRLHSFMLDGMAETRRAFSDKPVLYYPYAEKRMGEGKGLLEVLSARASVIITDQYPCFFIPAMTRAAAKKVTVRMEEVDSNGLVPLKMSEEAFQTAYHFRRFCQKNILGLLGQWPRKAPLRAKELPVLRSIPEAIATRWSPLSGSELAKARSLLDRLPIDHSVRPVSYRGGTKVARAALKAFLTDKLPFYKDERNHPDSGAESGLSPYLHFGHISTHEIVSKVLALQDWSAGFLGAEARGLREGWWGLDKNAEAFLDQLITWRELGYQFCHKRPDYGDYDSLPRWAETSLREHERDPRPYLYSLREFEEAQTHDPVWNAAERQLVVEGRIHNYLRMLWGKKILHWSRTPREALEIMVHLNNRFALDGRDPNSYSGIFWILGRHDRAWGPERAVFGKVRYMSSESTVRKLHMKKYLFNWGRP